MKIIALSLLLLISSFSQPVRAIGENDNNNGLNVLVDLAALDYGNNDDFTDLDRFQVEVLLQMASPHHLEQISNHPEIYYEWVSALAWQERIKRIRIRNLLEGLIAAHFQDHPE